MKCIDSYAVKKNVLNTHRIILKENANQYIVQHINMMVWLMLKIELVSNHRVQNSQILISRDKVKLYIVQQKIMMLWSI
jgi:hypothetical protein